MDLCPLSICKQAERVSVCTGVSAHFDKNRSDTGSSYSCKLKLKSGKSSIIPVDEIKVPPNLNFF
jgi:hypothetical protein